MLIRLHHPNDRVDEMWIDKPVPSGVVVTEWFKRVTDHGYDKTYLEWNEDHSVVDIYTYI